MQYARDCTTTGNAMRTQRSKIIYAVSTGPLNCPSIRSWFGRLVYRIMKICFMISSIHLPSLAALRTRDLTDPVPNPTHLFPRSPIVTGTSVLGLKYDGGVLMVSDMLGSYNVTQLAWGLTECGPGSYGSMARFKSIERLKQCGESTVVGAGGDLSDFQYIDDLLAELMCEPRPLVTMVLNVSPRQGRRCSE